MGLIDKLIDRSVKNFIENEKLSDIITKVKQSYIYVNSAIDDLNEELIQLFNSRGKKNKDIREKSQDYIILCIEDSRYELEHFYDLQEDVENFYKKTLNFKISKSNKLEVEQALNYKKNVRHRLEQIYIHFKSKGRNIDDIKYKEICKKMLLSFYLVQNNNEENFSKYMH